MLMKLLVLLPMLGLACLSRSWEGAESQVWMDGSPSALREAPPAAPRHWCRFHTANFLHIVLSSSSFVDQLSSANAIDASLRRGDGEGGRPVWKLGSHHELIVEISVYDISFHVVEVSGVLLIIVRGYRWLKVDWLVLVHTPFLVPIEHTQRTCLAV